jgi:hypothetical protein
MFRFLGFFQVFCAESEVFFYFLFFPFSNKTFSALSFRMLYFEEKVSHLLIPKIISKNCKFFFKFCICFSSSFGILSKTFFRFVFVGFHVVFCVDLNSFQSFTSMFFCSRSLHGGRRFPQTQRPSYVENEKEKIDSQARSALHNLSRNSSHRRLRWLQVEYRIHGVVVNTHCKSF